MILYDLVCDEDHTFESWFRNSEAAEKVLKARQSPCPLCGSTKVRKAPMAPRIAKGGEGEPVHVPAAAGEVMPPLKQPLENMAEAMQKAAAALEELRTTIEKTFDHVGEKFPEEARRIHYGDAPERPIYGDATLEEAKELNEEGIRVAAIPWRKRKN
jgi:hypothetical protein